ncbi:MAG: DNA adenine methylase [Rhodobacteraceae bacterium]|nr:DNA adenine methylase [Paracoccaceae bacterium]
MNALDQPLDLFGNRNPRNISTEGIKYAGSKLRLLPHILSLAEQTGAKSVFDPFSGTTRASQAFAQNGYAVTSSDSSVWSETFARCYLLGGNPEKYQSLIRYLNNVSPVSGWFTKHYGGCPDTPSATKRPWQIKNTRKLDGIRSEIDRLGLNDIEKSVALTSLVQALDRVDSTMGHFTSYLKDWSDRSYNNLYLKVPNILRQGTDIPHRVLKGDVFDVAGVVSADLAYLDPPYGSNNEKMPASRVRYASYYHIWTTVILNDLPSVFGAANRRTDSRDQVASSVFEDFRKNKTGRFIAVEALENLLEQIQTKWIILSYSSGGRATAGDLRNALSNIGTVMDVRQITCKKNVMAGMRWTDEWVPDIETKNIEYLFLVEKQADTRNFPSRNS